MRVCAIRDAIGTDRNGRLDVSLSTKQVVISSILHLFQGWTTNQKPLVDIQQPWALKKCLKRLHQSMITEERKEILSQILDAAALSELVIQRSIITYEVHQNRARIRKCVNRPSQYQNKHDALYANGLTSGDLSELIYALYLYVLLRAQSGGYQALKELKNRVSTHTYSLFNQILGPFPIGSVVSFKSKNYAKAVVLKTHQGKPSHLIDLASQKIYPCTSQTFLDLQPESSHDMRSSLASLLFNKRSVL